MTSKIYLIAGEPSGDLLGSRLMRALKKKGDVSFFGLGGETMIKGGLPSLFDISELSVMGFLEVLPKIPHILKRMNEVSADIRRVKPDIVITIDSWSFSERIHKRLIKDKLNIPHFHYVAPQAWAWKKGRAKKLKEEMDTVFSILPYEEKFFAEYHAPLYYVGHPVIEGGADLGDKDRFLKKHKLNKDDFILVLLPGSRQNEIDYLMPVFEQTVKQIAVLHPKLKIVMPTVATVKDKVKHIVRNWEIPVLLVEGEQERYDAFASARGAVAASGTVSLELAMSGVPHIIAYKVNKLTGFLARRLLKIRYVNLLNLLENDEIIPELLQENCTPALLVEHFEKTVLHAEEQHRKVEQALIKLGYGQMKSPSEKAADKVWETIHAD